jgi:hypothetical protein
MFSFFKKKPASPAFDDRVWLNGAARLAAIVRTAKAGPTLLITFFEETHQQVAAALKEAGLEFDLVGFGQNPPAEKVRLMLCAAERLGNLTGRLPEGISVCVIEHHPLPDSNLMVLEALTNLTSARPVFHLSIDEPLLRRFGGDKLVPLLSQLGVAPDEPIEHQMVTRALTNAREKVAARVKSPQPAGSMEEWLQFNYDADRR